MTVGDANDAAYTTPDLITAWVTNKGVRVMSIPAGPKTTNDKQFMYQIPDPFSEVFDGIAVGNSSYSSLNAKYFVYDEQWNTLLGFDEAYSSHQRLADHHVHYGYFVRAAAEICRVDVA